MVKKYQLAKWTVRLYMPPARKLGWRFSARLKESNYFTKSKISRDPADQFCGKAVESNLNVYNFGFWKGQLPDFFRKNWTKAEEHNKEQKDDYLLKIAKGSDALYVYDKIWQSFQAFRCVRQRIDLFLRIPYDTCSWLCA